LDVDKEAIVEIASTIDSENPDSLANLLVELMELEYEARHHKKPSLVRKFVDQIDKEQRP